MCPLSVHFVHPRCSSRTCTHVTADTATIVSFTVVTFLFWMCARDSWLLVSYMAMGNSTPARSVFYLVPIGLVFFFYLSHVERSLGIFSFCTWLYLCYVQPFLDFVISRFFLVPFLICYTPPFSLFFLLLLSLLPLLLLFILLVFPIQRSINPKT